MVAHHRGWQSVHTHSFTALPLIGDAIDILDQDSNDASEVPRSTSARDARSLPALPRSCHQAHGMLTRLPVLRPSGMVRPTGRPVRHDSPDAWPQADIWIRAGGRGESPSTDKPDHGSAPADLPYGVVVRIPDPRCRRIGVRIQRADGTDSNTSGRSMAAASPSAPSSRQHPSRSGRSRCPLSHSRERRRFPRPPRPARLGRFPDGHPSSGEGRAHCGCSTPAGDARSTTATRPEG